MSQAIQSSSPLTGALRISIHGIVQGVGFRPFVYRLAHQLGLDGSVVNNGEGVAIHVGGPLPLLEQFVQSLREQAPPMARIVSLDARPTDRPPAPGAFRILPSQQGGRPNTQIAPDIAVCDDCLAELFDPGNRRFRYPFINCTNCGPRFSIVERIPYDRPNTSMRVFPLCADCAREYTDPLDRRFHAQPNACPVCGPQLSWHDREGRGLPGDCLALAARALAEGGVVAIKGLGGFHLAVDGCSEEAVALLRTRKNRPAKPLAIMIRDLETAERFAWLSEQDKALLTSPEHPIVLMDRRSGSPLAEGVAPGLGAIGLMLPYTPLHHLLLDQPGIPEALVMTSGNRSDEPICTGNDEALRRLRDLADFFLLHNREIVTRVDDSVARIIDGRSRLLRRARGYSPVPLQLRRPTADILACGGEMKNSFCIVRRNEAYLSQHIGELTGVEQYDFFQESIAHLQAVLEVTPPNVACDLHPDYLSSRYAHGLAMPCREVQHHHAHIGAVLAEQGLDGPVLGIVLDGTGYGGDGTVFGGELFRADRGGFLRLGRLSHLPLPGGDRAALEPWRMALALLYAGSPAPSLDQRQLPASLAPIAVDKQRLLWQMMAKGLNCPRTSSCGRLFDAVAALLGLCLVSQYEGQAAMLLEHHATLATTTTTEPAYAVTIYEEGREQVIDSAPLAGLLLRDLADSVPTAVIARRFHLWLVEALIELMRRVHSQTGLDQVVLAGGCMQNKLLFETLAERLREAAFSVHAGELAPMNDGGLSLGQAYLGGSLCV
ncbi:(NiFe) hydrogenase maturation protein HypF [Desulfobulbus propionicus DSM 2032]|uniref:Carbamoyltransferase n=1 Tax=Desulfobulbus propionicus (strain ATCC 33891 / DSM 2032 / VKM B-1956 / 1pr3) TaxID=577650 RepID=A0A7U4DP93_DESPD|nr:carbamoyltransferase HypF [Desulfobulbus propionicus]ADW17896.1 (NiFe) hydrogenase maturation protein HypF [Desulfobulbus propionicus DSM 2032]